MSGDQDWQAADRSPAGPTVPAILEQDFDAGSLYALRSAVAAHAATTGLSPVKVYDVVAAAHELAANAVLHGGGRGHLRLRASDGILTCQVTNDGSTPADGHAVGEAPPWPTEYGHGLWLVEQVADQFAIARGPASTTATASFAISACQ
jgi:anti-sigma regulatory factor (Ser/Thr protein kinase)